MEGLKNGLLPCKELVHSATREVSPQTDEASDFAMLDIGCCLPAIALAHARRAGMLDEKQKTTEAFSLSLCLSPGPDLALNN